MVCLCYYACLVRVKLQFSGIIRVWDVKHSKEVFVQSNSMISKASEEGGLAVTHLLYSQNAKSLAVVSADHNIVIHNLKSFVRLKQFIGEFQKTCLNRVFN